MVKKRETGTTDAVGKLTTPSTSPSAAKGGAGTGKTASQLAAAAKQVELGAGAPEARKSAEKLPAKLPDTPPDPKELYTIPETTFLLNEDAAIVKGYRRSHVSGRGHLYLALASMALAAVLVFVAAVDQARAMAARDAANANPRLAEAQIIARREEDHGRAIHDRFYVTYQFSVRGENGETTYQREVLVERDAYDRLTVGSALPIKYMAENPTESAFLGQDLRPVDTDSYTLFMIAPIVVAGAVVLYGGLRATVISLYERRGLVIKGEIAASTAEIIGGSYYVTVQYKFRTPKGEELTGSTRRVREDLRDAELPKPGTPAAVLYVSPILHRLL